MRHRRLKLCRREYTGQELDSPFNPYPAKLINLMGTQHILNKIHLMKNGIYRYSITKKAFFILDSILGYSIKAGHFSINLYSPWVGN